MSDLITPWFYQFCWGFSSVPAADENREAEMKGYAQALCNAISGDGTASEAEVCVAMMPGVAFHSQPQNCCPRIAYIIAYASRCPLQIKWVQGYFATKGFGKLALEVETMAKSSEGKPIDAIIKETKDAMQIGTLKFAGRAIIYDAFRSSMIDGLHPDEEKSIVAIATAFDLTEDLVGQLKALAAKEEALRVEKAKLVTPGHPCLDPKYQQ